MSDFSEYYKQAWEKGLMNKTDEEQKLHEKFIASIEALERLKREHSRFREALQKISAPDPINYDGEMAYSYKMIARAALKDQES
jgi:hypothetical protein